MLSVTTLPLEHASMNHQHPQYPGFPPAPASFFAASYPPPAQQPQSYVYPTSLPQQQQQQQQQQHFRQPTPQELHEQQQQQSHFFQSLPQGTPSQPSHQPHIQRQHSQHSQQHVRQRHSQNQHGFVQPDLLQQPQNPPQSIPSSPDNGPGAPAPESTSPTHMDSHLISSFARQSGPPNHDSQTVNETHDHDDDDDDDDDQNEEGNSDDPVYQLPPPPEAIYPNEIELEKAMHAWSLEHGYELVRRASKKNAKGQLYKRYFHCSKHGKTASTRKAGEKNKVRVNRKSNRIGCPMSLAAVSVNPSDPSGDWQIRHRKTHHNHPAVDAINLAGHRRRARAGGVEKAVDGLFKIKTSTSDVLKFLQTTQPEGLFNRTDVANMKLKYKAHGTCASKKDAPETDKSNLSNSKTGFPTACNNCRSKKRKCDSVRPVCGNCTKNKAQCAYDHSPNTRVPQGGPSSSAPPAPNLQQANMQQGAHNDVQDQFSNDTHHVPPNNLPSADDSSMMDLGSAADASGFTMSQAHNLANQNMNPQHALEALAALTNFQQEHVKQTRLSLESSQVESLASSTCGNGDCYKTVMPRPFTMGADWRSFKDSFYAAAVRENTNDVLTGMKREPETPQGNLPVEEHNEYVKQLAIFKRRNEMLKIGLKDCLHPTLWSRIRSIQNAADMWRTLDDMCLPRGSDGAYVRFVELLHVNLPQSGNLDNYIFHLETKYNEYNQAASCHESRRAPSLNMTNLEGAKRSGSGDGSFSEEMLCFLFLQNLGPQYQSLAKNLTKKANIGGYGTGERVAFKQLTGLVKRHFEWEASRTGTQ